MNNITPPSWITETCDHQDTQSVRDAMIRFLYESEPDKILEDVRSLIQPIELWRCEMTTLYALYKLLKAKNVEFPERTEDDQKNLQIVYVLMNFLFPDNLEV